MKTNLLVWLLFSLSFSAFSQRVIEKPYVEANNTGVLFIDKITLDENATVLECTMNGVKGQWFSIPNGTYIQAEGTKDRLYALSVMKPYTLNKSITPKETGPIQLTITFPALPDDVKSIDYLEGNKGGNWRIYGISLSNEQHLSYLPNEFAGDWVTKDNTAWKVSFGRGHIIYNGEFYKGISAKEKKGKYTITMGDKQIHVEIAGNTLLVGEDKKTMQECVRMDLSKPAMGVNEYPIPTFKMRMDTAYYRGYLSEYSPKLGATGAVHVTNILTQEQDQFLIKIDTSGWFEVDIPMYYAQDVFFRMPNASYGVFLVPGETITQYVKGRFKKSVGRFANFSDEKNSVQFSSHSFDYRKIRKEIETMSIADYKTYCEKMYQKDLDKWAAFCDKWAYNDKIAEIGQQDIKMNYIQNLWSYSMNKSSFARKQQKAGKTYDYEKVDSSYYDNLLELPIDEEAMLSCDSYSSLINRLEYADWLFSRKSYSMNSEELLDFLKENGIELTVEEQTAVNEREAYLSSDIIKAFNAKIAQYNADYSTFIQKDYSIIKKYEALRSADYAHMGYYYGMKQYLLADSTIHLSADELQLFENLASCETEEYVMARNEFEANTLKEYSKINNKYTALIRQSHSVQRADYKYKKFSNYAGEKGQLLNDIMLSRQLCPSTNRLQPLYPSTFKYIDDNIKSPFIRDYIRYSNDKVLEQIELNKMKTGYNVNKVPTTEGEKLFDEMIKPFRGKVIYVDFWATWCGPCRSGMARVKPMKEELKENEDIVFLYITSNSSPENTWNAMIPDIKGEHYRLSKDEWNYISTQFGVTGIPHYMVVDKKGVVINNNDNIRAGSSDLKDKLLKYAAE